MKEGGLLSRATEGLSAFLLVAALVLIQVLAGGTRLVYSLPAYGLLAVIGLLALFSLKRPKPRPDQLCLAASALFFGYVLARAFWSPVAYVARQDFYSVMAGLLVYFFVACILTGARQRMAVLAALLVAGMAHVVIGAIQFTDGNNFMLISFLQRYDYGRRASGFYVCPNHLAGLLEVLAIFGLSIACWSRWPMWGKILIGYAAGSCYAGLVLTGSRGGYLSTMASLLVFAMLSLTVLARASAKVFLRVGGSLVVAATIIGTVVFFSIHHSYYLSARADNILADDLTDPSAEVRAELWQAALQQWRLQPAVGTGSGTYLYYGRQFRGDHIQQDPIRAHNDYLELLAEYGLAGAAGFLLFLGLHLRRGWKSFQRLGPKRVAARSPSLLSNGLALNLGALASVVAYMVHSTIDFNLHIPANVLPLALVFGMLANGGITRETDLHSSGESLLWWRLVLPLLGAVMAIQCARLLPGEYFAERARTALRDNEPGAAALFALKGFDHEMSNPYLYSNLGRALINVAATLSDRRTRTDCLEVALTELRDARRLAPRDETFARELGFTYDALDRFSEGEWMYQQAMVLDPKSNTVRKDYEAHLERWRIGQTLLQPARTPLDRTTP